MNLIILTTAITRGDFHKKSLGKFYDLYYPFLSCFNIYHIINLDHPYKLKDIFSKQYTIDLVYSIIPKEVNIDIIDNENPGFLNAYKNVVIRANKYIHKNNEQEHLIWWLEDDWDIHHFNEHLFKIIQLFPQKIPYAFNSVQNSPLGSFRGGPIMNTLYFKHYFDIASNNIANDTCDPEKQVGRWISGINRVNGNKKIHRNIKRDNIIHIIYFYYDHCKINVHEIPTWYYSNPSKYNKNILFKYHAIKSLDNPLNLFQYGEVDIHKKTIIFTPKSMSDILNILNKDKGIHYVCIKPWILSDIGRAFNEELGLNKWSSIHDGTSYV